jgi:vancomycin permeability regulator SanA
MPVFYKKFLVSYLFKYKWLNRILAFLGSWFLLHTLFIVLDGFTNYNGKADVAIVMGNRVYADGSLSSWLKGRVDKSFELYKQGRVKKIFVSGGISTEEDGYYPEGDAMKKYLLARGVPEHDIIVDNNGIDTRTTAKNFIEWNKENRYTSAIVVSQFFHITRSKFILKKYGFKKVAGAASKVYSWRDLPSTIREWPAFYKYLLSN